MLLLDTDVCIDLTRRYPLALAWYAGLPDPLALPGFVVMELLKGCRNTRETRVLRVAIQPFAVYWPNADDCARAVDTYARAHLSHTLGMIDALIAECAIGLSATLCTFNQKHYQAAVGLTTIRPYVKS
jgi:predicted nucleic acid-binding protein